MQRDDIDYNAANQTNEASQKNKSHSMVEHASVQASSTQKEMVDMSTQVQVRNSKLPY